MKKLFLIFITDLSLLLTGSLIILSSCHKTDNNDNDNSDTVVQGPLNPSFESGNDINADNWGGTYICPGGCCAQATRSAMQGPGFMPTSGTYYMSMQWNTYCDCAPYFYQDNVDLSTSTKLIVDWEYSGLTNTGCGGYTFYVLFSANGTDTLFHQTLSQAAVQKMNDTINLPSLPSSGRLLFTYGGSFGTFCQGTMGIDNIRVQ